MSNAYEVFDKAFKEGMKKAEIQEYYRLRKNHKHKNWSKKTYWIKVTERTCGQCGHFEKKELIGK